MNLNKLYFLFLLLAVLIIDTTQYRFEIPNHKLLKMAKILKQNNQPNFDYDNFLKMKSQQQKILKQSQSQNIEANQNNLIKILFQMFIFPYRVYSYIDEDNKRQYLFHRINYNEFKTYEDKYYPYQQSTNQNQQNLLQLVINVKECLLQQHIDSIKTNSDGKSNDCFQQKHLYSLIPSLLVISQDEGEEVELSKINEHYILIRNQENPEYKITKQYFQQLSLYMLNFHGYIFAARDSLLSFIYDRKIVKNITSNSVINRDHGLDQDINKNSNQYNQQKHSSQEVKLSQFFRSQIQLNEILVNQNPSLLNILLTQEYKTQLQGREKFSYMANSRSFYLVEIQHKNCPMQTNPHLFSFFKSELQKVQQNCTYLIVHEKQFLHPKAKQPIQFISKHEVMSEIKSLTLWLKNSQNLVINLLTNDKQFRIEKQNGKRRLISYNIKENLIEEFFLGEKKVNIFNHSVEVNEIQESQKEFDGTFEVSCKIQVQPYLLYARKINNFLMVVCAQGSSCTIYNDECQKISAKIQKNWNTFTCQYTSQKCNRNEYEQNGTCYNLSTKCPSGTYWEDLRGCISNYYGYCQSGYYYNGIRCQAYQCTERKVWNDTFAQCLCPIGTLFNGLECQACPNQASTIIFDNAYGIEWSYRIDYKAGEIINYLEASKRSEKILRHFQVPVDISEIHRLPVKFSQFHEQIKLIKNKQYRHRIHATKFQVKLYAQYGYKQHSLALKIDFYNSQMFLDYLKPNIFKDQIYRSQNLFKQKYLDFLLKKQLQEYYKRYYFLQYLDKLQKVEDRSYSTEPQIQDFNQQTQFDSLLNGCKFDQKQMRVTFKKDWNMCKIIIKPNYLVVIDSIDSQYNKSTFSDEERQQYSQSLNVVSTQISFMDKQTQDKYVEDQQRSNYYDSQKIIIICSMSKGQLPYSKCNLASYSLTKGNQQLHRKLNIFLSSTQYYQIYMINKKNVFKGHGFFDYLSHKKNVHIKTDRMDFYDIIEHEGNFSDTSHHDLVFVNYEDRQIENIFLFLFFSFCVFFPVMMVICCLICFKDYFHSLLIYFEVISSQSIMRYPLNFLDVKIKLNLLKQKKIISNFKIKPQHIVNVEGQPQVCCFCIQVFKLNYQVTEIYCKHKFHHKCFAAWLKVQKDIKCPLCKRKLDEKQYENYVQQRQRQIPQIQENIPQNDSENQISENVTDNQISENPTENHLMLQISQASVVLEEDISDQVQLIDQSQHQLKGRRQ